MTRPLLSNVHNVQFGSFHYTIGLVSFSLSERAQALFETALKRSGKISADDYGEEELLHDVYQLTSFFHEMRHLVDTFGTLAGVSLFSAGLSQLKEFAYLSDFLRNNGLVWQLPLSEWVGRPDCPQEVRDFLRHARSFEMGANLFVAPFEPTEIEGWIDDIITEVNLNDISTGDAFALRFRTVPYNASSRDCTVLYPLGFESLLEGSAHAVSRSFVEQHFPDIADSMYQRVRTIERALRDAEDRLTAAQTADPYMVVDLLISRFLIHRDIKQFNRNSLLGLVDKVLTETSIRFEELKPGKTAIFADRLGAYLINRLNTEATENLVSGHLTPDDKVIQKVYEDLLSNLQQGGDLDTIPEGNDTGFESTLAIWETYIAKHYTLPLIELRVQTNGQAFRTYSGFFEILQKIGMPPARVLNDKLNLSQMPDRVAQAWLRYIFLVEIVRQLVSERDVVVCPRAYCTIPGIGSINLAIEGNCDGHRRLGCGAFRTGHKRRKPNCIFESTIRHCSLEAPQRD